jgi:hypothetical protein
LPHLSVVFPELMALSGLAGPICSKLKSYIWYLENI